MIPSQTTQAERVWNPRRRPAYAHESVITRPESGGNDSPLSYASMPGIVATMLEQLDAARTRPGRPPAPRAAGPARRPAAARRAAALDDVKNCLTSQAGASRAEEPLGTGTARGEAPGT